MKQFEFFLCAFVCFGAFGVRRCQAGTENAKVLARFSQSPIVAIASSPSGKQVATISWDGKFRLVSAESGRIVFEDTVVMPVCAPARIAFSKDESKVIASSIDGNWIQRWNINEKKKIETKVPSELSNRGWLGIALDSEHALNLTTKSQIMVWSLDTGKVVATNKFEIPSFVAGRSIALWPDEKKLIVVVEKTDKNGNLDCWNIFSVKRDSLESDLLLTVPTTPLDRRIWKGALGLNTTPDKICLIPTRSIGLDKCLLDRLGSISGISFLHDTNQMVLGTLGALLIIDLDKRSVVDRLEIGEGELIRMCTCRAGVKDVLIWTWKNELFLADTTKKVINPCKLAGLGEVRSCYEMAGEILMGDNNGLVYKLNPQNLK